MNFYCDKIAIKVLGKWYAVRIAEEVTLPLLFILITVFYQFVIEKPVQFHVTVFLIKIHVKNTEVAIQYSSAAVEQMWARCGRDKFHHN